MNDFILTRAGLRQFVLGFNDPDLAPALQRAAAGSVPKTRPPGRPRESRAKPDLLTLPLELLARPLLDATARPVRAVPAITEPTQPDSLPDRIDVTLENLCKLHAGLLYRQLELLLWARDATGEIRRDILGWVFDGPYQTLERSDGSRREVLAIHVPFTFDLCCLVEEIDAQVLRQAIHDRLDAIRNSPEHRVRAALH